MLKKIVFLMVVLLAVGSAQADQLANGGFELGTVGGAYMSTGGYAPDDWYMAAGAGSWHQVNLVEWVDQEVMSVVMWGPDTLAQDFAVTSGTYEYSVEVFNDTVSNLIESPAGMSIVLYAEALDSGDAVIETVEVARFDCGVEPLGAWTTISGEYTTPGAAVTGRILIVFEGATGASHISFDNAVVTKKTGAVASDPWPDHGSPQIAADVNAAGYLEFTLPGDPSISAIGYDLYWVAAVDPNNPTTIADNGTGDPNERIYVALPETITNGLVYSWKVSLDVTSTNPDLNGAHDGPLWWFTTTNAPPTLDTGEPITQNVWKSGGSAVVSLDGVVSDDNLPDPPGVAAETWTKDFGPGSVVFSPSSDGGATANAAAATATFTTAGDYYLTLTADDGDFLVGDSIQITVLDEGDDGLVALYEFEGTASDSVGGHNGVLETLDEVDPTLPVIDSLDAQVGSGSLLIGGLWQRVYIPDSGEVDPNWNDGMLATWADMQTTNQVTVSTWLKVVPGLFGNIYASLLTKSAAYGMYRFDVSRTGMFAVGSWDDSDPGDQIATLDTGIAPWLDNGRWHHIAGTYDGAVVRYYVDGLLEGESYDSTYLNAMPIGGGILEWGYGMTGRFDQVRIHDIALSADMIKAQYLADGGEANCRQQYWAIPTDLDQDCDTDLGDFAIMASAWLDCSDLLDPACIADDGVIPVGP